MARKQYHVTPHPEGWQVKLAKGERASFVAPTKAEAVDAGKYLASCCYGQLYIHGKDGRIMEEHTYRKSYPPRY